MNYTKKILEGDIHRNKKSRTGRGLILIQIDGLSRLVSVCHHPDAGTYIISGWRPGRKPLSFSAERSAHGGPGSVETDAFALLSPETPVGETARNYLSVGELRGAVLSFLEEMDFKHDGKS